MDDVYYVFGMTKNKIIRALSHGNYNFCISTEKYYSKIGCSTRILTKEQFYKIIPECVLY